MQRKLDLILKRNAKVLVYTCGQVRAGDRILIAVDKQLKAVAEYLAREARKITKNVTVLAMEKRIMHGAEPSARIAKAMLNSDIIFGINESSMAHTRARMNASKKGARYLSLADYSLKQLSRQSLSVDFLRWAKIAQRVKDILDEAKKIAITSPGGTRLEINCRGRKANFCPGFCAKPGSLGSPPDIETNISPLEIKSNGILVVDGSIPCRKIGLIKKPFFIKVKNGFINEIEKNNFQAKILKDIFGKYPKKAKILAEFGIGLNPNARLCGLMLEDEGCLGTVHFGFGSNATIGGKNSVNFHLDFVIKKPTVSADGYYLMRAGKLSPGILRAR